MQGAEPPAQGLRSRTTSFLRDMAQFGERARLGAERPEVQIFLSRREKRSGVRVPGASSSICA
jgi:hypothetical protein